MLFFFFFQAEDGIRDLTVTGVQTCALPISPAEDLQCDRARRDGGPWAGAGHPRRARFQPHLRRRRPGQGGGPARPPDGRGDKGEQEVVLEPFDTISVPPGVMRGFRNAGPAHGYLMAILGGTDSGKVAWAKSVLARAKETGLGLDARGNLVELVQAPTSRPYGSRQGHRSP